MQFKETKFIGSFPTLAKCPPAKMPEFAFIGRSNVGKSSLINMLCGNKKLAKVSKKPGKTAAINFFQIDSSWFMVDLPGYGYAVRSKGMKKSFRDMIYSYIEKRRSLACTFILIDANVPPQKNDLDFMEWMGSNAIPFVIAYTKMDRLNKRDRKKNIETIQQKLLESWNELPQQFMTSSEKKEGKEEILAFIREVTSSLIK
ncbi:MAG TPA: YihA family ribosome biogenesis GTP-binding protein [Bacteroidetes bacterium]|nr:YihA family ribosome biogenesis GTP-binding protein [Bacteroidota bacterium]